MLQKRERVLGVHTSLRRVLAPSFSRVFRCPSRTLGQRDDGQNSAFSKEVNVANHPQVQSGSRTACKESGQGYADTPKNWILCSGSFPTSYRSMKTLTTASGRSNMTRLCTLDMTIQMYADDCGVLRSAPSRPTQYRSLGAFSR